MYTFASSYLFFSLIIVILHKWFDTMISIGEAYDAHKNLFYMWNDAEYRSASHGNR